MRSYQALLTRRYLTSKIMPLLAAVAVMLCVAMVLITWSVMGGFLRMLLESGKTMVGDVEIRSVAPAGFAYYDDLRQRLEADPLVEATTPTIETFGLVKLPLSNSAGGVTMRGIEPASFDKVTGFNSTLWWKPLDKPLDKDTKRQDPRLQPGFQPLMKALDAAGQSMQFDPLATGIGDGDKPQPALVLGLEVGRYYNRRPGGFVVPEGYDETEPRDERLGFVGTAFQPGRSATITVLPTSASGATQGSSVSRQLPIANNFRTGLFETDANTILVPLPVLQKMLNMDAARVVDRTTSRIGSTRINPQTGKEEWVPPTETTIEDPARVNAIYVKAKPGVDPKALRARVEQLYDAFARDFAQKRSPPPIGFDIAIQTWDERPGIKTLVAAVKKETALVLFLFGIISLTSTFLVLAIFWAMVSEKTKDIGILRAIGASKAGVAWLWIRYGLSIGLIGAGLGIFAAWGIVTNINTIHDWLGRAFGLVVWDPSVYYFSSIPNQINLTHAAIIFVLGILSATLGALIPAFKAARMDPVRALRFE
jgi:lipoprotein-releasing system permease protein